MLTDTSISRNLLSLSSNLWKYLDVALAKNLSCCNNTLHEYSSHGWWCHRNCLT